MNNWKRKAFDKAADTLVDNHPDLLRPTVHDLRHTAASLAISAGANVKAVQRMLGHASAAMTLDVYADLFDDDLDAVGDALSRLGAPEVVGKVWANPKTARVRFDRRWAGIPVIVRVGPVGLEPTTRGLKVRCSTN